MRAETLFRLTIKPDARNDVDPFGFCLDNGIVGAGWGLEEPVPLTPEECEARGRAKYGGAGFAKMIHAMTGMRENDLVWTRRPWTSEYYLCRVTGPWEHRVGPGYDEADIHNVVPAEFVGPFDVDEVPGKVVNCFRAPSTVQRVQGDSIDGRWVNPSLEMSMRTYNSCGRNGATYDVAPLTAGEVLRTLLPEDVEELVSLYLQVEKDYLLYSSSNKIYTAEVEFEMVKRDGSGHCYTQVKTGGVTLDPTQFANLVKEGVDVYLYSTDPSDDGAQAPGMHVIGNDDMTAFMLAHREILPRRISRWLGQGDGDE